MKGKKAAAAIGLSILAAVMITVGLLRVVQVYKNYRSDMLAYESRHLNSIVSSGARGLDWMLEGYASLAGQLVDRREFSRAEEGYLSTGDRNILWALMDRPGLFWPALSASLAVYSDRGIFLASSDPGFPLSAEEDKVFGELFSVRRDAGGEYWFIFRSRSDAGFNYEIAVPVVTLFAYQSDATPIGEHGYLFMIDCDGTFAAWSGEGESEAASMQELLERFPRLDAAAVSAIAAGGWENTDPYYVCRYPWSFFSGYGSDETLVVTCPVFASDGGLLLGAAMSFQEFDSLLSDTLREITVAVLLEVGGAMLLFFLAAWIQGINRRGRLELAAVRERMELMEEINRQQQGLAHTERLQQLGVMTSGMVHEFNNMLTPIMGQSMLLLEELADQEDSGQFECALDIYEASESAREILRRMSAMGKKNVDMGFAPLEVGELLRRTMNLASMAKDPHIRQELSLPDEPVYILGNSQLLTQAILNLCINGCQAMESEGVLSVSAAEETRAGHRYVTIRVSDTGPGIPEDNLGSIYEPFYTTKGERGTGLGLAICQKIIETHKGTIQAGNRETGGAIFTVRIPACDPPE